MKKLLLLTLCFSIPILVGYAVIEWAVYKIPTSYSYKASCEKNNAEVLVLGSSLAFCHVNPDSIHLPAINMANSAQPLRYDLFLFDKYAPQMPHLKYVVMPIAYFTFSDDLNGYIGVGRDVYYAQNYGFPYPPKPEYYLHSWSLRTALGKIKAHYIDHAQDIEYSSRTNGFGALGFERRAAAGTDWDRGAVVAKGYGDQNAQYMGQRMVSCIEAFDQIAQQCTQRNIELILYTSPVTRAYRQAMDTTQWQQIQEAVVQIEHKNPNVRYYNFLDHEVFSDDDFKDADHLLEVGANKLTKLIDQQL